MFLRNLTAIADFKPVFSIKSRQPANVSTPKISFGQKPDEFTSDSLKQDKEIAKSVVEFVQKNHEHYLDDKECFEAGQNVGKIKNAKLRKDVINTILETRTLNDTIQEGLILAENLTDEERSLAIKKTALGGFSNPWHEYQFEYGSVANAINMLSEPEKLIKELNSDEKTKSFIPKLLKSGGVKNEKLFDELVLECISETYENIKGSYTPRHYKVAPVLGKLSDSDCAVKYIKEYAKEIDSYNEDAVLAAKAAIGSCGYIKDTKKAEQLILEFLKLENKGIGYDIAFSIKNLTDSKVAEELRKKFPGTYPFLH